VTLSRECCMVQTCCCLPSLPTSPIPAACLDGCLNKHPLMLHEQHLLSPFLKRSVYAGPFLCNQQGKTCEGPLTIKWSFVQ